MTTYICPDCTTPLVDLRCPSCHARFEWRDGLPILLPTARAYASAASVGAVYDDIYATRSRVWEDQGRTEEFIGYVARLVTDLAPERLLEIGCGEGLLLAALPAREKHAIDLSAAALSKARAANPGADFAVALAERLPFPDASFDALCCVGVMEHFFDEDQACREMARVLTPGGHCVVLIHVARTRGQELVQKFREFVWPVPRPIALTQWAWRKVFRPIRQPIQRRFTLDSARQCLARAGLDVRRVITTATAPEAPLIGPHVVIYLSSRRRT